MTNLFDLVKNPEYLKYLTEHARQELRHRACQMLGIWIDPNPVVLKIDAKVEGRKLILEIEEQP